MNVLWKKIKIKHFGHYRISNYGQVHNTRTDKKTFGHKISEHNQRLYVCLNDRGIKLPVAVAKLVLTHFKKDEINLNYAIHINGFVQDNCSSNLKWGSRGDLLRMKHKAKNKKRGAYAWGVAGRKPWRALMRVNSKMHTIGYYSTKEQAYGAYYIKYIELFGVAPWNI